MAKRQKLDLPRGQLTLEQLLERRSQRLLAEAREIAALKREMDRERREMEEQRKKRAMEAILESRERGSMKLPKLIRGV